MTSGLNSRIFLGLLFLSSLLVFVSLGIYYYYPAPQVEYPPARAFPGAEGFGAVTEGGRFGRVIAVTNLNDTLNQSSPEYAGSFRWALEQPLQKTQSQPYGDRRFIVFKVNGTIDLVEPLVVTSPFTTIAGQSAPGSGITLRGEELVIATHDVIVRGLRIRIGDEGEPTCCRDGLSISTTPANTDVYNVMVDHLSISWAIDENLSFATDPSKPHAIHDVTVQWSIVSEGLHNSIHIDEGASTPDPHSMGMLVGEGVSNVSIHHNLFAHNWGRNPRVEGVRNAEIFNNVIYGWEDKALEIDDGINIVRVRANYFKRRTPEAEVEIHVSRVNPESAFSFAGNVAESGSRTVSIRADKDWLSLISSLPNFEPSDLEVARASSAYDQVLKYAGSIIPSRDAIDARIVKDVKQDTGSIIDSQDDVGGWVDSNPVRYPDDQDRDGIPTEWEIKNGLNPADPSDASNPQKLSPAGYTWIEEYVNSLYPPVK